MAEIVAAALTSHAPLITGKPEIAKPEQRERFYAGYREIRRRLVAARPDLIMMFERPPPELPVQQHARILRRPGRELRRPEPRWRPTHAAAAAQGAGSARMEYGAPRGRARCRLRLRVLVRDRELGRAVGAAALPPARGRHPH